MSYFNNLILSATQGAALSGIGVGSSLLRKHFDGTVKLYTSKPYDNIFVYSAKRDAMQIASAELRNLVPQIIKNKQLKNAAKAYDAYQGNVKKEIIKHNQSLIKSDKAWHYKGQVSDEGILMWIKNATDTSNKITFKTYWDKIKNLSNYDPGNENYNKEAYAEIPGEAAFLDMTALVNVQSHKNLVLTKVQGRDYSRKELVSNGDMEFTINGKIVSNYPDTYPAEEVSKFLTLMNYKGVIQVYGLLFEQLHVTQILIKDFRLNQNMGYKNVQPYSFSCVAVEPDTDIQIIEDTLEELNLKIAQKKKSKWIKMLETIGESAASEASSTIIQLTSNIL